MVGAEEYRNDYAIQQEDMRANRPALHRSMMLTQSVFQERCYDFDDLLLKF